MATFDELRESLQTSNVSALLAKAIDPILVDYKRQEAPLQGALARKTWPTPDYYWDQVNQFPRAQATTEAPSTTQVGATQSTYVQKSVSIKHTQVQGDIAKFAIKTAHVAVENLLQLEMMRSAKAMAWYEDLIHIYGSVTATSGSLRPQWSGFDQQTDKTQVVTAAAASGITGGTIALQDLDNLIDALRVKVAAPLNANNYFFLLSEPMQSEIARLFQSNTRSMNSVTMRPMRDNGQVGSPVQVIESGGVEVLAYRGVPLVCSTFISPHAATWGSASAALSTIASSAAFSSTASRHYILEAVDDNGVTLATADFASGTIADADHAVTITSFAPTITDAFANTPNIHLYRLYEGSSATNQTLYGIVSAYDSADNAVDTIYDYGVNSATLNSQAGSIFSFNASATTSKAVAGHSFATGATPTGDGVHHAYSTTAAGAAPFTEKVRLITRNPDYVVVPTVTELESEILAPVNARTIQYACIADLALAVRTPLFLAELQGAKTA